MCNYYDWQMHSPNECYAIGAFHDLELVGFCFSGVFADAELHFVLENWFQLSVQLLKNPHLMLKSDPFRRIGYIIRAIWKRITQKKEPAKQKIPRIQKYGVLSIAVNPETQEKGVGKMLMEKVYEDAIERGFSTIYLSVHKDNEKAISFYEKDGWMKSADDNGNWSGIMIKNLRTDN